MHIFYQCVHKLAELEGVTHNKCKKSDIRPLSGLAVKKVPALLCYHYKTSCKVQPPCYLYHCTPLQGPAFIRKKKLKVNVVDYKLIKNQIGFFFPEKCFFTKLK